MYGASIFLPVVLNGYTQPAPEAVPLKILGRKAGLDHVAVTLFDFDKGNRGQVMTTHFDAGVTAIVWGDHVGNYDAAAQKPELNLSWTKWLAQFGRQSGMNMAVHHLVFPGSVRDWFDRPANRNLTPGQFLPFFAQVITEMVRQLGATVDLFSVVNEPWYPDSGRPPDPFRALLGPDYMRTAFEATRAALRSQGLSRKTFFSETATAYTREPTRRTVEMLLADGYIDGLFMQAHEVYTTEDALRQAVAWIDGLGIPWRMSEITGLDGWIEQALTLATAAANCTSICFWEDPHWAPGQTLMDEDGVLTSRFGSAYYTLARRAGS
jgi:hypothetical protein